MSDQPFRATQRLNASGPREIVYCHQCENEWYQDDHGLVCPRCEGEITEIVTAESDPRPASQAPQAPPDFRSLHNHNPWDSEPSDPEEADIEEHVSRGPGGSFFISQTIRSSGPGHGRAPRRPVRGEPADVLNDFQSVLGNLMGHDFRPGMAGRSGRDDLYPPPMSNTFRFRGNGSGPEVVGGRFTYTSGRLPPRNMNETQAPPDIATLASPPPRGRALYVVSIRAPPDQLARLIGNMFGQMAPPGEHGNHQVLGMPPGLQGLFASLLNPANARSGDAVYTQEALDQIISTLMEQHPTSNAPGPASPDAIAALPKRRLDEKLLGPEGKGECTVCMDDVKLGDEVVMLPCNHWFHEPCAAAWLSEHNTCPICRKAIDGDIAASPTPQSVSPSISGERPARRLSLRQRVRSSDNATRRNEARLDSIRDMGRLPSTGEAGPATYQIVGDGQGGTTHTRQIPGSFPSPRRRDSEMSENQRDGRRRNTSGSDQSRESPQSSGSASGGGNSGSSGPISWFRDRFGGSNNDRR